MATGLISPIAFILQAFSDAGIVGNGFKVATYLAGSSTPVTTYTDSTLVTPNPNPIVLQSNGRLPASVWAPSGTTIKMVLSDASGNVIPGGTVDNLPLINDISASLFPQTTAEINAGVTPANYLYQPGDIRRYGALITAADNTNAIQAAINQAQQTTGAAVRVPCGTWTYLTMLSINTNGVSIFGDNQLQSILQKSGNIVGLNITANAELAEICFSSAGGDSSTGIVVNTTGHVSMNRVRVLSHGSHGIDLQQANLHNYSDVTCAFNAGDGIHLSGSGTIQANANVFQNINCASNTGLGINFLTANANMVLGISCHNNVGGGMQFGACTGNVVWGAYTETNTGADLTFTSACVAPTYGGNTVVTAYADDNPTFASTSGAVNTVYTMKPGATHQPMFSNLMADQLVFSNQRTDGTTPTGIFTVSHANNLELDVSANSASNVITKFLNPGGGQHQVQGSVLVATGAQTGLGAGTVVYGGTTQTTVGAAGGATAQPATPLGYILCNVANTIVAIPYHKAS